jgi:hypothetical protein
MLRDLPGAIKTVEAEAQGKDLTPRRQKELQERVALLKALNEQLPSFVFPRYVDMYNSLKHFVEIYNVYSQFPDVQKMLLTEARKHYSALSPQEKQALFEKVALDTDVQKFLNATAGVNGFFGYNTANGFKNDMLKFALERIRLGDNRALSKLVPTLFDMRSLVTTLLSDKENYEIFYSVLSGMADNRYAEFLADITQNRFEPKLLPVIFNATLYLASPRVRQLIDTMRAYKKTFENAQQAKPKNQRIVFPIDDKEFKQADALYEEVLKNEQEHAKKEREASGL